MPNVTWPKPALKQKKKFLLVSRRMKVKAIKVKYLPATNHRPSRLKASDSNGHSVTAGFDHFYNDGGSLQVAQALCSKMNWSTDLVGGVYGDSDYYVFRDQS